MHDPRIGRFFATDPLEASYPWYTPYQFSGNKVISHVELEGLEEAPSGSGSMSPEEMVKHIQSRIDANDKQILSSQKVQQKAQNQEQQIEQKLAIANKEMAGLERRIGQNKANIDAMQNTFVQLGLILENSMTQIEYSRDETNSYWTRLSYQRYSPDAPAANSFDQAPSAPQNLTGYKLTTIRFSPINMATGSCYSCGIADPFIQVGQEGLAGGLQKIGMSESSANYASAGVFFFGSILLSRKLGSMQTIGLGLEDDLILHRGTGAITYKSAGWQQAGLTNVNWGRASIDNFYFKQSFEQTVQNASLIRFEVTNFNPFYHKPGMTNFEFNHIISNPSLLKKTTFIKNGNPVNWNGSEFIGQ